MFKLIVTGAIVKPTQTLTRNVTPFFLVGSGTGLPHKILKFQSHHKGMFFIKEIVVSMKVSICRPHNQL